MAPAVPHAPSGKAASNKRGARVICLWNGTRDARLHVTRRALLIAVLAACDRGHNEPPVAPVPPVPAPAAPAPPAPPSTASIPGCTLTPHPLRVTAPHRLVAIGDLHG